MKGDADEGTGELRAYAFQMESFVLFLTLALAIGVDIAMRGFKERVLSVRSPRSTRGASFRGIPWMTPPFPQF